MSAVCRSFKLKYKKDRLLCCDLNPALKKSNSVPSSVRSGSGEHLVPMLHLKRSVLNQHKVSNWHMKRFGDMPRMSASMLCGLLMQTNAHANSQR